MTLPYLANKYFGYIRKYLLAALLLAYILGNMYVLINKKLYFYPYNLLPVIFFMAYLAIFHLQKLVLVLAFFTPLSFTLKDIGLTEGINLSLPTEPLMATIMLMYMLLSLHKPQADRRFLRHPITALIFVQLLWMFITTLTSEDLVVSMKYFVSRLWFIFSCYIIIHNLYQGKGNIKALIFSYASALLIVVVYTIITHARFGFDEKSADWVVSPFYNDHTAYGAALAMFIPVMFSFILQPGMSTRGKLVSAGFLLVFIAAIILSFARAGWLSLAIALAILVTLLLKIRLRMILLSLGTLIAVFLIFKTEILMALGKVSIDSEGGFENNLISVFNISTDASNLERLNRWSCALRMWEDKPVFGWGPGNYMFEYAPYQLSGDLTVISTNFATGGNAHSEYLGPLAEQGLPGLIIVVILLFASLFLGYRLVYSLADRNDRVLCAGLFLGLMTYFVHGLFNNFLDTDKLSLPFWSFLSALVCLDLYGRKKTGSSGLYQSTTINSN